MLTQARSAPHRIALDAAHSDTPGGVQIDHLTVRFGSRTVLDDLSLTIQRGELLTVLGRSGCGKTTLLRFIAGFIEADGLSGTLTVAGHDLTHVPPHKRNLGLLFQSYALFPHLSVFENVAFGLRARRTPSKDVARRVADALKLVQLGDAGHVMPAQLSGGMQQRVALARALVIEPDVLLLDEPLSALDANLRASVRSELKALHERLPNLTIVCVTHDQDDALVLSDRTLLMREGRIAQLGTPQQLYDTPDRCVRRALSGRGQSAAAAGRVQRWATRAITSASASRVCVPRRCGSCRSAKGSCTARSRRSNGMARCCRCRSCSTRCRTSPCSSPCSAATA